jgi:hypothetical protein
MAQRKNHQLAMYCNADFAKTVENAADNRDVSVSSFLQEAVRRELQRMEIEA